MFCSTYKALFEGRKDLFKGLFIAENTDYDFKPYPVFYFSFSDIPTDTFDNFLAAMTEMVRSNAETVGISLDNADYSPSGLLNELTYESCQRPSGKPEGLDMSVLSTDSVSGLPVAPHPYG